MDPLEAYEWMLDTPPTPPDVTDDVVPGKLKDWRDLVANPAWQHIEGVIKRSLAAYTKVCTVHNGLSVYRAQGAVIVLETLDNLVPSVIEQKLKESRNPEEYQNV